MLYIKSKDEREREELRKRLHFFLNEFFPEVHYTIRENRRMGACAEHAHRQWIPRQNGEKPASSIQKIRSDLEAKLKQMDAAFSAALLKLIDEKGLSDAECYKRANVDRRLFSKIRSNEEYHASKATVLAFAIALQLDLEETEALLEKAGYTLSNSKRFDVIVKFFIAEGFYDINVINEMLHEYDLPLLGSSAIE